MSDSGNLVVKLALDNSNFQRGIQNMNRSIRKATSEFKSSAAGSKGFEKSLDGLQSKAKMLEKQIKAQSQITESYRNKLEESRKTLNDNAKAQENLKNKIVDIEKQYKSSTAANGINAEETKKLKQNLDELTTEYQNNEEKIRNNVRTLENYEIKTMNASSKLKNMQSSLKDTSKEIDIQSNKFTQYSKNLEAFGNKAGKVSEISKSIGKGLTTYITTPLFAMSGIATKIGMDFEASMSNVKALAQPTAVEFKQLESKAREMGAQTSKSATEAADALGYMSLAGWDVQDSLRGIEPVLRLSEAGNIDLARSSSLVTDSMASLGIEVKDLDKYLDIVAQTARNSNTDIDQMMEAYLAVGGTLRGLKVPAEDSAIALGLLANAGIKGSEGGKSLNAILLNLTAPAGRAKDALEELNYTAFDADGTFKGLTQVLFDVKEKTEDMTDAERNRILAMIGGKEHVKGLNALLNGLGDSYDDLKYSVENADGALDDMASTMLDNNKGSITELKSALEELGLKLYDQLRPNIANLIELLKSWTDKLNNLTPQQQENIVKIGKFVAAIGPLFLIVGKTAGAISTFSIKLGLLSKIIAGSATATSIFAGAASVLTGPVGLAIAGVTALAIGGKALSKQLNKSSLDVNLFSDTLETEISNSTQTAVNDFLELDKQASQALVSLKGKSSIITKETANEMVKHYKEMGNVVIDSLNEDKEEALSVMKEMLSNSIHLTEEEQQQLMQSTEIAYQEQKEKVKEYQNSINEIYQLAAEERRELTDNEKLNIKAYQEQIRDIGIATLSETEAESKVILQRLRDNRGEINAQMLADTVKSSLQQKEKAIEAAEEQYDEQIRIAEQIRAQGGKKAEETADKIIAEAQRQKQLSIEEAEEMHDGVVNEAKEQAKEHVDYVDWETGEVLTKWEKFKANTKNWWEKFKENNRKQRELNRQDAQRQAEIREKQSKENWEKLQAGAINTWKNINNRFKEFGTNLVNTGKENWSKLVNSVNEYKAKFIQVGSDLMLGLKEGIVSKVLAPVNAVKNAGGQIITALKDKLGIKSPSRVFMSIGKDSMDGWEIGITNNAAMVAKSTKNAAKLIADTGHDELIKRLSFDTGDNLSNFKNTVAIAEVQKDKIESLSKAYDDLLHKKAKNSKEQKNLNKNREQAKKDLESAKTDLIKYNLEINKSYNNIIKKQEEFNNKIKDEQIKAVDELHSTLVEALKNKYNGEHKLQEESLNKEINQLEKWKEESIKRINQVYNNKIKRIDEAANTQIKAIEKELEALDQAEKEKTRKEIEDELTSNITQLEEALEFEHDEYNRAELEKQIEEEKRKWEEQQNQWALEDKKEQLKNKIDLIKKSSEEEKTILENRRLEELEDINHLYDFERNILESKIEDNREMLQQKTNDKSLQAEAEKLILKNQQDDIIDLLHQYKPDYHNAGASLGQQLFDGMKPQIWKLIDMINFIREEFGYEPISDDEMERRFKHLYNNDLSEYAPVEKSVNRRRNQELYDDNFELSSRTNNYEVNIYSPKALGPREQRKAMSKELRKISLEM